MYNSYNDDIFDAILTTAFHMYWDKELASMPSDEELAEMYPVPQKQVRQMLRYAKRLEYNTPIAIVYLRRFAVVCLVILSLTFESSERGRRVDDFQRSRPHSGNASACHSGPSGHKRHTCDILSRKRRIQHERSQHPAGADGEGKDSQRGKKNQEDASA